MTYNFCTLFDKNYLTRGLALYESLLKFCPDFKIWMLCMDAESYEMLKKLDLDKIIPLSLEEVEDTSLLSVKNTRTAVEYCWMMSSSLPLYLLEKNKLDMITYLDADMYFFHGLQDIYEEFGSNSIMLIPHRFLEKKEEKEKNSGIYNVGMMIFRNDENGLKCLRWWKEKVVEWCYSRYEEGKYGDQLYLNDWPQRFKNVHILKNHGANTASWNIKRYVFFKKEDELWLKEKNLPSEYPLIFYHCHGLKFFLSASKKVRPYPVTVLQREIYKKYIEAIQKAYEQIWTLNRNWNYGSAPKISIIKQIKQILIKFFKNE